MTLFNWADNEEGDDGSAEREGRATPPSLKSKALKAVDPNVNLSANAGVSPDAIKGDVGASAKLIGYEIAKAGAEVERESDGKVNIELHGDIPVLQMGISAGGAEGGNDSESEGDTGYTPSSDTEPNQKRPWWEHLLKDTPFAFLNDHRQEKPRLSEKWERQKVRPTKAPASQKRNKSKSSRPHARYRGRKDTGR